MKSPSRYYNRELSVLDFQDRVLALAEDPNLPLLERVKFVAIVASNLDEFFQVRVAGLREQVATGVEAVTPEALTPREQLDLIRPRVVALEARLERLLAGQLLPGLADHGVFIVGWDRLKKKHRKELVSRYEREIYPMLTPLAVDPQHPFPYISNLSLNLAVMVRDPDTRQDQFARVKVPPLLPRLLPVADGTVLVPVEQVLASQLDTLFPGKEVVSSHPFRVTRSADQAIEEDEAEDLLEAMEELLQTRHRFSRLVRLVVDHTMPVDILDLLMTEMRIEPWEVYVNDGLLALAGLNALQTLPRPDLKLEPWMPTTQPILSRRHPGESVLDRLDERDVLVHLPYESFGTSVGAFIASAARDPDVVAIKQTLYRTSDPDDPALGGEQSIVQSLIAAARRGKQVVVLVELKARFDEEANISWARILEEAGVHVVYGVPGLKTHAKIALVVRREGDGLKRYSHIGTGNYNPKTARIYEDLGLLTADDDVGADLSELFNVLTGYGQKREYRRIIVAPHGLRDAIVSRIRAQAALGHEGNIVLKLNHVVDPGIIDELYAASAAGTRVELIVRGICCLRPGVPGLSENIRVRSIVGRYLEHSRVLRFGSGEDAEYIIGSSDLMPRNLDGRVEVIVPIHHPRLRRRLEELLRICLADDRLAWELNDDSWKRTSTILGLDAHRRFQALALARSQGAVPDPGRALEAPRPVLAAGGIVSRTDEDGRRILLVHRPRYDDWSFPKGKVDDGETAAEAALREVAEETGYQASLGDHVGVVEYPDRTGRPKIVHYWAMTVENGAFAPNAEVDEIAWLDTGSALDRLTYERDRAVLRAAGGAS
ncbi:MAG TPA: polyphosphate kinase 1 [Acidimicrobiia bacterium]|nr:polyphosphate kinase 1 [Acidimicrobiia bacterium]